MFSTEERVRPRQVKADGNYFLAESSLFSVSQS
jgi:hypothetical protein